MAKADERMVRLLLERHGRTFAEELGIRLRRPGPSALFRLVCASLLMSARIRSSVAVEAARGLRRAGWTTAQKLADSTWDRRVEVLNRAGYTRYQERTATMLGEAAAHLLDRWGGDLRKLREEADRDPRRERRLLKELKGMGDVGVDILFREVQGAWRELAPFADRLVLAAARRLGLGGTADDLAGLVRPEDFPRLAAALVRVDLEDAYDDLRARG